MIMYENGGDDTATVTTTMTMTTTTIDSDDDHDDEHDFVLRSTMQYTFACPQTKSYNICTYSPRS